MAGVLIGCGDMVVFGLEVKVDGGGCSVIPVHPLFCHIVFVGEQNDLLDGLKTNCWLVAENECFVGDFVEVEEPRNGEPCLLFSWDVHRAESLVELFDSDDQTFFGRDDAWQPVERPKLEACRRGNGFADL